MDVMIRGTGVAASCCAHLLRKAGLNPRVERTARPGIPAIMLSEAALTLMRDVFERPELLRGAPRISRRVVKWGPNAQPLALDHAAVVVSEQELLGELDADQTEEPAQSEADFTIIASRPLPPDTVEPCFGSRTASAAKVRLKDTRDSTSCWIESLRDGWLFLIPNAVDSAWLLSVGSAPGSTMNGSCLIADRVASISDPAGRFPASPRIASPLGGPQWLACGTAGMAFDPICGDGTAHAVREAILASAVVRAIADGGDAKELLSHYEARLTAGFARHLAASLNYYRTGEVGPWWDKERALLEQGLEWCAVRMNTFGKFRYQLSGFELKAI